MSGPMPQAFCHFLRNDSRNLTMTFEDFDVASGMFSDNVITNPGKGLLTMLRANIRNGKQVSDLFDGSLMKIGEHFGWSDGEWLYASRTRPLHRSDGRIVGTRG